MNLVITERHTLKEIAQRVSSNAYAPYSRFSVGAAVVDLEGRIFSGCNVENISYGLAMCAERNAIAAAVAAGVGAGELRLVLIYTPGNRPAAPCGACRQVMQEFMLPEAVIISACDADETLEWTVEQVLPDPFRHLVPSKPGSSV